MKKLLAVLLLIAMLLTACQSGEKQAGAQAGIQSAGEQKVLEIEFWHALGGDLGESLDEIVSDFNASQKKYVVKPVVMGSYDELTQKLQAAYAAKNVPALVVGDCQDVFYKKGLIEPFEDYMPKDYDQSDIVGGFLKAAIIDGKMVYAPAYGTSQVLYYNKAVLEEAGFSEDDLKSWQSIAAMSKNIIGKNTGEDSIKYVWEPMWGYENIADIANSNGGSYLSADGKTVTFHSEEWVAVLEQVRKWLHEDKIMSIHSGGQGWEYWYKTMDDWVYGKALGYTGSPGDYAIALDAVKKATDEGYKNEFAVACQPGYGSNQPAPYFSSRMYFIPKCSNIIEEQKTGAAAFISFATNTKNTAAFSMATGYVAVRNSVIDSAEYQEYLKSNPDADIALKQIDQYAVPEFIDPTGGAVTDALKEAVDQVEIENVPAKQALDEAAAKAQKELDKLSK